MTVDYGFKIDFQEPIISHCLNDTNPKESDFKDLTVWDTKNFSDMSENKEEIPYNNTHSSSMVKQNENERISQCPVCRITFSDNYHQHVETAEHKTLSEEYFGDRIDFVNYLIYSSYSSCITIEKFLSTIENNFTILVNHLILMENTAVLIDVSFYALFHEESSNVENKNIAEIKRFDVHGKKLTKDTNVNKLYQNICKLFLIQSDTFQKSGSGWSLEETLYVEISIVKKLFDESKLLAGHSTESNDLHGAADNLKKTAPLQLLRCKVCGVYVVQKNYQEHLETTAHQITACFANNDKIQIHGVQCEDLILGTRIISSNNDSIDDFFCSIESDVLDLVGRVISIQKSGLISVGVKLFGLYNQKNLKKFFNILGDVKPFIIKNEILSRATVLSNWFRKVSDTFKLYNKEYLDNWPKKLYFLVRIMFLDINFYEVTNV